MKTTLAVCLAFAALAAADYVGKHEDFDLKPILNDKNTLHSFVNCMTDKGPCTSEFEDIKDTLAEKFNDKCAKCSPKQIQLLKFGFGFLAQHEPQLMKAMVDKFDPEGKLTQMYSK